MPKRSYSGCLTCRSRKLKCDEQKPVCFQCRKASRDCEFSTTPMFRLVGDDTNLFNKHHVWVDVPRQLEFINIDNPYDVDTFTPDIVARSKPSPQDVSCTPVLSPSFSAGSPVLNRPLERCFGIPGSAPDTPLTNDFIIPYHSGPQPPVSPGQGVELNDNILVPHLLQHFKNGPGQWMDLFDHNAYFSSRVILLAASKHILRAAVCALAAKHIHSIQGGIGLGKPHPLRIYTESELEYKCVEYYDEAISQLKADIARSDDPSTNPFPEEVHATVAILCLYELMDAPSTQWKAHLKALPILLASRTMVVDPDTTRVCHCAQAHISAFWSLARQDCLSAYLDNACFWKEVGLEIQDNGLLVDNNSSHHRRYALDRCSLGLPEEVVKSQELFWINGKVVNHISRGDGLSPEEYERSAICRPIIGVSQETLLERWKRLKLDLDRWWDSRLTTHRPCARIPIQDRAHLEEGIVAHVPGFVAIYFSIPICAATMLSYHMVSILMCMNKPHESTARWPLTGRMNEYRRAHDEALEHSREICGICLAQPPDSVVIHSVQPLFVAGQCFYQPEERQIVVDLLIEIERSTGWATGFQIRKLRDEWGAAG